MTVPLLDVLLAAGVCDHLRGHGCAACRAPGDDDLDDLPDPPPATPYGYHLTPRPHPRLH